VNLAVFLFSSFFIISYFFYSLFFLFFSLKLVKYDITCNSHNVYYIDVMCITVTVTQSYNLVKYYSF